MAEYTNEYNMADMDAGDLQNVELITALAELDPDEARECYRITFRGERGQDAGGTAAEMLYLPHRARAGVAWSGEVAWMDASSAEEAMERYLDHDWVEDNIPGL